MAPTVQITAFLWLAFAAVGGGVLAATTPLPVADPVGKKALEFERDVYPILKANCIACHNKTTTKADLNMETPELMKKGGESGTSLVPAKASESPLFQAAVHTWESPMPPKGNKVGAVNLKPEELGVLKRWIDEGAKGGIRKARQIAWQPLPAGLNPIFAATITPDGRWAACSRANQIWIYDLGTRRLATKLTDSSLIKGGLPGVAHRDLVQSLAFSPDGTRLASGSFQEIKIWRRQSPPPTAQKAMPPAPAIVEADLKKLAADLKIAGTPVLALTADGKKLAAAGSDGVIRLWDTAAKAMLREIRSDLTSTRAGESLQWETARQQLEINYQTDFITRTETELKALEDRRKKSQDAITNGKKAVDEKKKALPAAEAAKAAAEKEVQETQALVAKLPAGTKPDAALEKKIKEAQEKLDTAVKDSAAAVAAVKTAEDQTADAEAEVKNIDQSASKTTKTIADAKAAQAAATQALATAKASAAKAPAFDASKDGFAAAAFAADGSRLAVVTVTGALKVWSVDTGAPLEVHLPKVTPPVAAAAPALTVAATTDGGFAWTQPDATVWSVTGAAQWILERTLGGTGADSPLVDRVNALRFSPDGRTLVAGGGEPSRTGDITLWDTATGKLTQALRERHSDSVLSLDISPDGKFLASGGADKAIRVCELPSGKPVRVFEGHTHHVLGVSFRADGRILASAGADNVVKVWDMITGDRKKNVEGWDKEVTSIQFLGATDQLLTSAGDNRVRVVRDSGPEVRLLGGLPDFMYSAAGTHLGSVFIAGGQDSVLRLWESEKGTELAQFGP